MAKTVDAMKKVSEIRQRREGLHVIKRLQKGRVLEKDRDRKEVERNLSLIKSPAAGLVRDRGAHVEVTMDEDESSSEEEADAAPEAMAVEN